MGTAEQNELVSTQLEQHWLQEIYIIRTINNAVRLTLNNHKRRIGSQPGNQERRTSPGATISWGDWWLARINVDPALKNRQLRTDRGSVNNVEGFCVASVPSKNIIGVCWSQSHEMRPMPFVAFHWLCRYADGAWRTPLLLACHVC